MTTKTQERPAEHPAVVTEIWGLWIPSKRKYATTHTMYGGIPIHFDDGRKAMNGAACWNKRYPRKKCFPARVKGQGQP